MGDLQQNSFEIILKSPLVDVLTPVIGFASLLVAYFFFHSATSVNALTIKNRLTKTGLTLLILFFSGFIITLINGGRYPMTDGFIWIKMGLIFLVIGRCATWLWSWLQNARWGVGGIILFSAIIFSFTGAGLGGYMPNSNIYTIIVGAGFGFLFWLFFTGILLVIRISLLSAFPKEMAKLKKKHPSPNTKYFGLTKGWWIVVANIILGITIFISNFASKEKPVDSYLPQPPNHPTQEEIAKIAWNKTPEETVELVNTSLGFNMQIDEGKTSHSWRGKDGEFKRSHGYYFSVANKSKDEIQGYKNLIHDFLLKNGFVQNFENTTDYEKNYDHSNTIGYEASSIRCVTHYERSYISFGCGTAE